MEEKSLDYYGILRDVGTMAFDRKGEGVGNKSRSRIVYDDTVEAVLNAISIEGFVGLGLNTSITPPTPADDPDKSFSRVMEYSSIVNKKPLYKDDTYREGKDPLADIDHYIDKISVNIRKLKVNDKLIQLYQTLQQTTSDLLESIQDIDSDQQNAREKKLANYLKWFNIFLTKFDRASVYKLHKKCKKVSETFPNKGIDLKLQTYQLIFHFFITFAKKNNPMLELSELTIPVIDQIQQMKQPAQAQQVSNLDELTQGWMDMIYSVPDLQPQLHYEFFTNMLVYYKGNPELWQDLLEKYAYSSNNLRFKEKMLFRLKNTQLEVQNVIDTKLLTKRLETAWIDSDIIVEESSQEAENRQNILNALDTILVKIDNTANNREDSKQLNKDYRKLTKFFCEHESKAMVNLGIVLIITGILLMIAGATLFATQYAPAAANYVPDLLTQYLLSASITISAVGAMGVIGGSLFIHRHKQTDDSRTFRAFERDLNDYQPLPAG